MEFSENGSFLVRFLFDSPFFYLCLIQVIPSNLLNLISTTQSRTGNIRNIDKNFVNNIDISNILAKGKIY